MLLLLSADFLSKLTFFETFSGTLSACKTVWIQIRLDIVSGLIWVQTVCKGYHQQTDKVVTNKERALVLKSCRSLLFIV